MLTLKLLAVGQQELGVVPAALLRLLDDLQEVLEEGGAGEVAVVVDVDDGELGVLLVEPQKLVLAAYLVVGEPQAEEEEEQRPSQFQSHTCVIIFIKCAKCGESRFH
jgi:hypothetical protein